jgi:HSP20 family protein
MTTGSDIQTREQKQQEPPQGEQRAERGQMEVSRGREMGATRPDLGVLSRSPIALFRRMIDDIESLFGEPFTGGLLRSVTAAAPMWAPRVDVLEEGNELVVRADLPGIERGTVTLEISDDGLVIAGEGEEEREEKDRDFYRRERMYGSFRRVIPLPEGIDPKTAKAEMNNGVLEVRLRKPERPGTQRIEIVGGGGDSKQEKKEGEKKESVH